MGRGRTLNKLCVNLLESLDVAFFTGAFARGFRYYAHQDIHERRVGEVPLQRAPVVMRKLLKERTLPDTAFLKPCEPHYNILYSIFHTLAQISKRIIIIMRRKNMGKHLHLWTLEPLSDIQITCHTHNLNQL